jgi:PelA/Pel-15E family pectate lyase
MKRATAYMVDKVSTNGGYVWTYLPDLSRRWGELEARKTQIWIQPPGTPTMGHLFLDAFHATGDESYYKAAEKVAAALIRAQQLSGGWNYLADVAGEGSLREWYDSVGRNAWRLEEFQYNWGNATFDDAVTAEAAKFLLRLYAERRDPKYRPALDRAIRFVVDSQYPIGGWPQRYPQPRPSADEHLPAYPTYLTFNDGVAAGNIEFLLMCHRVLGDVGVLEAIQRGMHAFVVTQQRAPQAGWALQYTLDLKPAGARTYEPRALATHTTAANAGILLKFYRLTGDTKFLARVREALDWLDSVTLSPEVAAIANGGTHPTFIEVGTNRPLYVHRTGSNVVNGRYFVDYNPRQTIGHYSAFRHIDVAELRRQYAEAQALSPADAARDSPLVAGVPRIALPRYFAVDAGHVPSAAEAIAALNAEGYWPAPLGRNSHPFRRHGSAEVAPGDFSRTHVGDDTDTSPFPDHELMGISTAAYIRHMSALIRALDAGHDH